VPVTLSCVAAARSVIGSAAATIAVLAVVQATRWSRRTRTVKRPIAQRERETVSELDTRMVAAASRLASMSLVTKTRQEWALIFAAILFFVSGVVATMQRMGSADPAQGTPALAFTAFCLVLGVGALVVDDRLPRAGASSSVDECGPATSPPIGSLAIAPDSATHTSHGWRGRAARPC
jgi:hypothetical protein